MQGYLATVTTQAEDDFLKSSFSAQILAEHALHGDAAPQAWLGGFSPGPHPTPDPSIGWEWITGETWLYAGWGGAEPGGGTSSFDNVATIDLRPIIDGWNDTFADTFGIEGYIVEYSGLDFDSATTVAAGSGPYRPAVGDMNGDGQLDLVVPNWNDNTISVHLGDGDGTFPAGNRTDYPVGNGPAGVAVGDLNTDGQPDLVVTNQSGNDISVLLGTGPGTYARTDYPVGTGPVGVAIGDLNGDGQLDLGVTNNGATVGTTVSILHGSSTGTFTLASTPTVGFGPSGIAISDVNSDGQLDLAVTNYNGTGGGTGGTVTLLLQDPPGTYTRTDFHGGNFPAGIVVGDLNWDGQPDLAVANHNNTNTVSVLLGNGTGTVFDSATSFPAGSNPNGLAIEDLNGDGQLDLAVGNNGGTNVSVLLGTGIGTFDGAINYPAGTVPHGPAIGDFDQDGRPDLAVANHGSNTVSILLNDTIFSPRGTFNAVLPAITVGTGPTKIASGDLNEDGRPDLAVVNYISDNVSILLGDGTGGFDASTPAVAVGDPVRGHPGALDIGDLDGDGHLDLAVPIYIFGNVDSNQIEVFLGNGDGTFGAAPSSPYLVGGLTPHTIKIHDFNRDGQLDLVVTNSNASSNSISVLLQKNTGPFGFDPAVTGPVGPVPGAVVIGDLNRNGKPDLVVMNNGNGGNSTGSILLGTGTGPDPFPLVADSFFVGNGPTGAALGDFDRDGKLDLAVPSWSDDNVSIRLGTGAGTFDSPLLPHVDVGEQPQGIGVGDLDGDGKLDLAVANNGFAGGTTISILLNDPTVPPSAPTNVVATAGNNQVALTWTPSTASGITEQRIYRSETAGTYGAALTTFNDNTTATYTDTTAVNGTTYFYVVRAFDGTNESGDSNEETATPDGTAPVLNTATATATSLVLNYTDVNGLDAGSVPAIGDFVIGNTGAAQSVTTVAIAGNDVTLTLNPGVANGDTVTVDYTAGATPLQDPAGNPAANLTTQAVTNTTADVTVPVLNTATVTGASLVLNYTDVNGLDAGSVPATGDFVIGNTGAAQSVTTVAIAGNDVTLTLNPGVAGGDTVTVDYTAGPNPIQDPAGNDAANLVNEQVSNQTPLPFQEDFSSNTLGPNLTQNEGATNTSGGNAVFTTPLGVVATNDVNYHTIDFTAQVTVVTHNSSALGTLAFFGLGRGSTTPDPGDNFNNPASGPVAFIRHMANFSSVPPLNFINNLTITTNDENNGGLTPGGGMGEILNQDGVGPGYGPYTLKLRYIASTGIAQFFVNGLQYGPDVDVSSYDFTGEGHVFFGGENVTFDDFIITPITPLATIGINFDAGSHSVGPSDNPGIVSGANWNNVSGATGGPILLQDDTATPTTASLSFSSVGTWDLFETPATSNSGTNTIYS
jgi:uncharacterized repeat protein (TIGR02059 family)